MDEKAINLLEDIKNLLSKPKAERITFTIQEAAEFCGFSHTKVRELVDKSNTDFPFFKVGTKALIDKGMLVIWLEKISVEHRTI